MSITRRAARETAVLILYARQQTGSPMGEVIERVRDLQQRVDLGINPGDSIGAAGTQNSVHEQFLKDLVLTTVRDSDEIDRIIAEKARKWDFERLAMLDRIILRIAIAEMLHFTDIPSKVSINEALEIAKKYSTDKSSKFINGILDAVKQDLEHRHKSLGKHS